MGDHRRNPVSLANAVPQQQVRAMDLGDNIALLGIRLVPSVKDGNFAVLVVAGGGRMSDLMPMQPTEVVIGVVPTIPMEGVKALLSGQDWPATPESPDMVST